MCLCSRIVSRQLDTEPDHFRIISFLLEDFHLVHLKRSKFLPFVWHHWIYRNYVWKRWSNPHRVKLLWLFFFPPPRRLCFHLCLFLCRLLSWFICLSAGLYRNSLTHFHKTWWKEYNMGQESKPIQLLFFNIFTNFPGNKAWILKKDINRAFRTDIYECVQIDDFDWISLLGLCGSMLLSDILH